MFKIVVIFLTFNATSFILIINFNLTMNIFFRILNRWWRFLSGTRNLFNFYLNIYFFLLFIWLSWNFLIINYLFALFYFDSFAWENWFWVFNNTLKIINLLIWENLFTLLHYFLVLWYLRFAGLLRIFDYWISCILWLLKM